MTNNVRQVLRERLLCLGEALGLSPSERLDHFLGRFHPYLSHFMEFGVVYDAPTVVALSFGHGDHFHRQLLELMDMLGFSEAERARVQRLREDIDDWMVVKVDVLGSSQPRLGVYFRRAMTMAATTDLLQRYGVSPQATAELTRFAAAFDSRNAQIFAVHLSEPGPPLFKVYVNAGSHDQAHVQRRLLTLFAELEVPTGPLEPYLTRHQMLTDSLCSSMFVSFLFQGEAIRPQIKLDYFCVPLESLQLVLAESGLLPQGLPGPVALGHAVGLNRAEHFGILFGQGKPSALSLYFPFLRTA